MRLLPLLRMAWLLMALPAVLQAQTIVTEISNLGQPIGTGGRINVGTPGGESFTTGNAPTTLSSISILISYVSPTGPGGTLGSFTVAIYSDGGGLPLSSLAVLSGNNYPHAGTYAYTAPTPLVLAANTTYWVVVSSTSSGSAYYGCQVTTLRTLDAGSVWTLGYDARIPSSSSAWVSNNILNLQFSVAVSANLPTAPVIAMAPTASVIVSGQTLGNATLSGGSVTNAAGVTIPGIFAFNAPLTVPATGTTSEWVTFTPTDNLDYYSVTTSVPVTAVASLGNVPLIASLPTASTLGYGQTLASDILSGGAATNSSGASLAGSFTFNTPTVAPAIGTSVESVTFTPVDRLDYIPVSASVPVTVIPFSITSGTTTNGFATNNPASSGGITIYGYFGSSLAVTIPDTINGLPVVEIGTNAFYRSSITSITISTNVGTIAKGAFEDCNSLTSVTIPDGVTNLGIGAFNVCSKLVTITFPDSLTTLSPAVFAECTSLSSVTIPDSVTSVGESAFDDCSSLSSVTIGCGVTNIGIQAFSGFNELASITVASNNPAFCSVGGVLFDKGMTTLVQFPGGWNGSYSVPDGVGNIGYESFGDCGNLTSVILPDSVTNIDGYAFIFCTSLTSITIPGGVTTIPEYTFAEDTSLTNVVIGGEVASFGGQASQNAVPAVLPGAQANAVTSLGGYVFSQCTGLASVYMSGNAPSVDGTDFGSDSSATVYYMPGTTGWAAFSAVTGIPAVPWNPQAQTGDGSFGVKSDKFGFNITGSSNLVVMVMACTNLTNPVWSPVSTNTLNTFTGSGGTSYFSDPNWKNYPSRFYGFSFP